MNRFLFIIFCVAMLFAYGCGDDDPVKEKSKNTVANTLTFTRYDASHIQMGGIYAACCDPLPAGPGEDATAARRKE